MTKFNIVDSGKVKAKNWFVEIEGGKVWNFKRKELLDTYGNPVYEIYPPYEDIVNGLPKCIGRRNNRKNCYSSNGYGQIENIGMTKDVNSLRDIQYILEQFYGK